MISREGADTAEVIVKPTARGGWQVEIPRPGGAQLAIASTREQAVLLARHVAPACTIRILPAH